MKSALVATLAVFANFAQVQNQIAPDCELEFASHATSIIKSQISDTLKLAHIQAILSSCNKSRMQKLAEISIFLLNKGTFPTKAMEEIRKLGQVIDEGRRKRLNLLLNKMPFSLSQAIEDTTKILLNSSLSGNEKVLGLTRAIGAVPREHRRVLEDMFRLGTSFSQNIPHATSLIHPINGKEIPGEIDVGHAAADIGATTAKPFLVGKDKNGSSEASGVGLEFPSEPIIRRSNTVPKENVLIPSQQMIQQRLQSIKPVNNGIHIRRGEKLQEVTSKDHGRFTDDASHTEMFSDAAKSLEFNSGRAYSPKRSDEDQMDDIDLLNPRSSIVSDAVRFLEKNIPIIDFEPTQVPAIALRHSPLYTFALPDQTPYPEKAPSESMPLSEQRVFLPLRDEALLLDPTAVTYNNHGSTKLIGYDIHTEPIASGVPNRVVLHRESSKPTNEAQVTGTLSDLFKPTQPKSKANTEFFSYPDYSKKLFPVANDHVQHIHRQWTPIRTLEHGSYSRDKYAREIESLPHNVFSVGNHPTLAYAIAPRPKHSQGHELLETDRLGSWSIGKFSEEELSYPTPEPKRRSTTVMAVLHERTTNPILRISAPQSPRTIAANVLPIFQPNHGPESATDRHASRELYDIKHLRRSRFVKTDLINE